MRFALNVGSQVSLDNFSLSQLIIAIKELFEKEGLPGFLRAYLKIVEVMLFESGVECKCCGSEHLHGHATVTKTGIGKIKRTFEYPREC